MTFADEGADLGGHRPDWLVFPVCSRDTPTGLDDRGTQEVTSMTRQRRDRIQDRRSHETEVQRRGSSSASPATVRGHGELTGQDQRGKIGERVRGVGASGGEATTWVRAGPPFIDRYCNDFRYDRQRVFSSPIAR